MHTTSPYEPGPPRIFTDAPARCTRLPGGFFDFDAPCNVIVHRETTRLCLPEANSRLAIRCAFGGQRRFTTDGSQFVVDDGSYLLLNLGQRVASSLVSPTPVECFNITFQPGFAEDVLHALVTPDDQLLDEPFRPNGQPVQFCVRTYPHDDLLSPTLMRLRSVLGREPVGYDWLAEQFHLLMKQLLQVHRNSYREVEMLPAMREATRREVYLRLHRARDFMEAGLACPLLLEEIARVACFSPYHFLRLFKQMFHETPHQYLTRRRMERAGFLLARTDLPVTEVCMEVGFDSLGSFSTLFRRHYGHPPTAHRATHRGKN